MRRPSIRLLTVAVVALIALGGGTPGGYHKYYVVAEGYQGQPEYLSEIAARFLADPARAAEILTLNAGREQPDGGRLTDPERLRPGWVLILPWDAFGEGVRYGPLPGAGTTGSGTTGSGTLGSPGPTAPATAACQSAGSTPDGDEDQWGALRVAADRAWPVTDGSGVLVAVADSGVDASLPAFDGRVAEGTDLVTGNGRGDTDCRGTGTALASIVAASAAGGSPVPGVAPGAAILPVRMVGPDGTARPEDQVAAIDFAVAAGARVLLLGAAVTPSEPDVATAIAAATGNGLVVVLAAGPQESTVDGVLWVAPVGIDGTVAGSYPPGAVDVIAPGVAVAGLGISGSGAVELTGASYAAAYAAGVVALVRARFPGLGPAQVVHRMRVTATPVAGSAPDGPFGAGMVDPATAVSRMLAEETPGAAPPDAPVPTPARPLRAAALTVIALLVLGTVVTLALRARRLIRPPDDPPLPVVEPAVTARPAPVVPAARAAGENHTAGRLKLAGMAEPSLDSASPGVAMTPARAVAGRRATAATPALPTSAIHSGQDGDA